MNSQASPEAPPAEGGWLALAFQLPTHPASARVRVWRRLQTVGSVPFSTSLHLLPLRDDTLEDFEWTLREVEASGGTGAVFRVHVLQGTTDADLRATFNSAREEQFHELADDAREALAALPRRPDALARASTSARIAKLRRRLESLDAIDFFGADGRDAVLAVLAELESRVSPQTDEEEVAMPSSPPAPGTTWVTRVDCRVDRLASAWLIRRWLDPAARFKFVTDRRYRPEPGEVRFDMYDAEYTHVGDRCTFETLLQLVEAPPRALHRIAEIVHELDLKDGRYDPHEAAGVKQLLAGLVAGHPRDEERVERACTLFDDLFRSFDRDRG